MDDECDWCHGTYPVNWLTSVGDEQVCFDCLDEEEENGIDGPVLSGVIVE